MIRLLRSVFAALALTALVAGGFATAAFARAGAYLTDLIRTEPYRTAWINMLSKERNLPSFVKDFTFTHDGVTTPAHMVPVGYQAYLLATLCEAHACADHMLYVIFAPDGSKAYAELIEAGKARRLLGKPNAAVRAAIAAAHTP